MSNSDSHGLVYFINVGDYIYICSFKSNGNKVCIKLVYVVNILFIMHRIEYSYFGDYYKCTDLLFVFGT